MRRLIHESLSRSFELPCGLVVDGEVHVDVVIEPLTMRESMAYEALAREVPDGLDPEEWRALCRIVSMTRRLGSLPSDQVTPELLLDAAELDVVFLSKACNQLMAECSSFRGGRGGRAGGSDAGSQRDGLDGEGAAAHA